MTAAAIMLGFFAVTPVIAWAAITGTARTHTHHGRHRGEW